MAKKYVVANWKGRLTLEQGQEWLQEYQGAMVGNPEAEVIIAPPCISLVTLCQEASDKNMTLGWAMQDISPYPPGAYTGSIPASLVKDLANYVIVGHPERRRYFHEDDQDVANKAFEVVEAGMTPVICLDSQMAAGQIGALHDDVLEKMIAAYTPHLSGQTEKAPLPVDEVAAAVEHIASLTSRPVLYGGGITISNAPQYAAVAGIAGLMAGGGSLKAADFAGIVRAVTNG